MLFYSGGGSYKGVGSITDGSQEVRDENRSTYSNVAIAKTN